MPEQSGGTRILQLIAAAIIATTATIGTLYVTSTSTYTEQGSDPVNPGNGKVALYAKTGKMYYMGSDGQAHEIGASQAAGDTLPVIDTKAIVYNAADNTKQIKIDATTVVSGTAVLSSPPASTTLAGLSTTQTFTGTNTFAPISGRGTQLTDNGSNFYQRWYSSASGGSNLYLYSGWPWANTSAFTGNGSIGLLVFDAVNGRLGININGSGAAPLDQLSFGRLPSAFTDRAMINLTNTALVNGNANGTYIGANPVSAAADLINYQISGISKFKVESSGKLNIGGTSGSGTISGVASEMYGAPTNSATSAFFELGRDIAGGNTAANGGTWFGVNAPSTGAGSAADFINLQNNGVSRFKIDKDGSVSSLSATGQTLVTIGSNVGKGSIQFGAGDGNNQVRLTQSTTGTLLIDNNASVNNTVVIPAFDRFGLGTVSPKDQLSFANLPAAGATRAMVNLTNTTLNSGSASGTFIGANPAVAGADFVNFQVNGTSKFKVDNNGAVTATQFTGNLTGDLTGNVTGNVTGNCSGTSANVTGVVAVVNGGTGKNSVTAGSYLAGNGTGALVEKLPSDIKTDLALTKGDVGLGNVENTALSTWAGSANITTLGTITTGTWNGNTIAIANGGTGQTSKAAAFDALSPTVAKGDLIVHNGTNNVALTAGTDGYALVADSTQTSGIKWASVGGADPNAAHVNTANTFTTGIQEIQTSTEAVKLSGSPAVDATKALMTLGTSAAFSKADATTDGGTWLGIKAPTSGAGADGNFIYAERGGNSVFRLSKTNITLGDSHFTTVWTIQGSDHTQASDTGNSGVSLTVKGGNETANSRSGGYLKLQSGSSAAIPRSGAEIYLKPAGPSGVNADIEITPGAVGADNSNACVFINKNAGNTTIGSNVASTAHSTCNVFGSFAVKVDAISSNINPDNAYHVLPVNANSAAVTVNLPDATTCKGREYIVKKIDASANTVTLDAYSTQTIDGALTQVISAQWSTRTVVSDGTNWIITNKF